MFPDVRAVTNGSANRCKGVNLWSADEPLPMLTAASQPLIGLSTCRVDWS